MSTGSNTTNQQAEEEGPYATTAEVAALKECIQAAIKEYSTKGTRNKRGAIVFHLLVTLLSVATTILLGWKTEGKTPHIGALNTALICSAAVAGLNVVIAFFDYKELWVQYKVSRNKLEVLASELKFREAAELQRPTKKKLLEMFDEYKAIRSETNQNYMQLRMAKDTVEAIK